MTAAPLTVEVINTLDQAAFTQALGYVFEHSPWVVERTWAARPFASRAALHAALMATLEQASAAERLALVRAHPELGGKLAIAGDLTLESRAEQASAGLDQLTRQEYAHFHELNSAYGARFGHPFIICVRLNTKSSIMAALERRLQSTPEAELAEAIAQIGLISRLRLYDAVADVGGGVDEGDVRPDGV